MPLPNVLTSLIPQLADVLIPRIADLFRKDTRDLKAAVDAEIASLARAQAELNSLVTRQAEAVDATHVHVTTMERKVDLLVQQHADTSRQIAAIQTALASSRTQPAGLIWAVFALSLMTFGVSVGLLFLRR